MKLRSSSVRFGVAVLAVMSVWLFRGTFSEPEQPETSIAGSTEAVRPIADASPISHANQGEQPITPTQQDAPEDHGWINNDGRFTQGVPWEREIPDKSHRWRLSMVPCH